MIACGAMNRTMWAIVPPLTRNAARSARNGSGDMNELLKTRQNGKNHKKDRNVLRLHSGIR